MANNEDVVRILLGAVVWNAWRLGNPERPVDLSGADLSTANLRGANLRRANLRGANLRRADLREAILRGAKLGRANLRRANLRGANLRGADLRGAKLGRAKLGRADLREAILGGADLRGADLRGAMLLWADLREAKLGEADLRGADLREAKLGQAILREADLRRADLGGADLGAADLGGAILGVADLGGAILGAANLGEAKLGGADLRGADLGGADLHDADLRQATLIDSRLAGANLTGAKLWETQRGGWSIKGVICQRAFWDRDGKEPTEYGAGDFERIFAEKPRIVLRYPGGISPVDFAMLPLIIERLQAEHPGCALHIRSVQDDGGGATVTITVDDLVGRSDEAFVQDVEVLRRNLTTIQQRLQQEERLRLKFEAGYRALIEDVLPMLLERVPRKTEVNVGQLTGPIIIEGNAMSRDTYNVQGAGAVGPNAHAHDMTFQQVWSQSGLDLPRLAQELAPLRAAMKQETEGTAEQDKAIGAVAAAEKAAAQGDGPTVLRHLKAAGKWTLGIAEKIGVAVAAKAIEAAMAGSA